MIRESKKDVDQLARFKREVKNGSWVTNARGRAQRRKSAWNFLLPLLGLPLWGLITMILACFGASLHELLHPSPVPFFSSGPIRMNGALVLFPSMIAAVCPAFYLTNRIVYLVPSARRALDLEARTVAGRGYHESQRALLQAGLWVFCICVPLLLLGALLV